MKKLIILILFIALTGYCLPQEKLNLKKSIQIALENNKDLVTIKNDIEIQNLNIKLSKGNLIPDLVFNTGWSRTNSVTQGGFIYQNGFLIQQPDQNLTHNNYSLGLNSQVTLFNGLANSDNIKLNNQNLESLNLQYEKLKKDIMINVTSAYFNLLTKSYIVGIYEENLKNSRDQLALIKEYVNVGSKTISEVYKQDVQVAQNELSLESSMNDMAKAKVDLLFAMYANTDADIEIDLKEFPVYTIDELKTKLNQYGNVAGLSAQALSNRYDYKTSLQEIKINETKLSIANENFLWPSINAFGSYNLSGASTNDVYKNRIFTIGLSLNYTIFQGFNLDVNKQIAQVNVLQKQQDLTKLELQIKSDIKKGVIDLQTAYKQAEILDRSITSAEQDVKLSEENYRIGKGTLLDLQTAIVALNNLRINKINAVYGFLLAEKQIDYLTGIINY
jgi:outer membrane protein TolC